jgi:hypothetical protein
MKNIITITILSLCLFCCKKQKSDPTVCDIQKTYIENATKVTISNGIWGTVSSMEGDCMPSVPPTSSTCTHCPVKRTVKIYEYTLHSQAIPSGNSNVFFDSFNTQLVAQANADDDGFFQINIPAGHYTIVIIENGKLYASGSDGQGGLNPITYSSGLQNVNLLMTYKATF